MGDDEIDWTTVFRALAAAERRALVQHLVRTGRSSVDKLAAGLAEGDDSGSDEPNEGEPPTGLRINLIHAHLPKLSDAGLICWDRDTGEVATTPLAARIPRALIEPRMLASAEHAPTE